MLFNTVEAPGTVAEYCINVIIVHHAEKIINRTYRSKSNIKKENLSIVQLIEVNMNG